MKHMGFASSYRATGRGAGRAEDVMALAEYSQAGNRHRALGSSRLCPSWTARPCSRPASWDQQGTSLDVSPPAVAAAGVTLEIQEGC